MQLIQFGEQLNTPIVVCLGYFGCMHVGHAKLVERAKLLAKQSGAKVALFTFSNDVLPLLNKSGKAIYAFDERLKLYENIGADYVLAANFDEEFRSRTGDEFVSQLKNYHLDGAVCGFDYTYGRDRNGCNALSQSIAPCPLEVVEPVCFNGEKVSTTLVRAMLENNRIKDVNRLLSEPYFLSGVVVHGNHIGTELGFPTANVQVNSDKYLPTGVYSGNMALEGKVYKAVVNIGGQPTFGGAETRAEAYLADFDGDLYGRFVKISLTDFLRPVQKFADRNELVAQLKKDCRKVLND